MAEIRLQVLLNGRTLCVAGLEEHGTLTVTAEVGRVPGVANPFQPSVKPDDERYHELTVAAQTWITDNALQWAGESIGPGDEITIRVLGPGPSDEPAKRIKNEIF